MEYYKRLYYLELFRGITRAITQDQFHNCYDLFFECLIRLKLLFYYKKEIYETHKIFYLGSYI